MEYTFFEAAAEVFGTDRKVISKVSGIKGRIECNDSGLQWIHENGENIIISSDVLPLKQWEVEPEPEPIYVWGKCEDNNASWIYVHGIPKTDLDNTIVPCEDLDGRGCCFKEGLFPKDKFQKFRLVPVDDETEAI